mmetsp:Transcript_37440/g.52810  ORF Transcript_37440/g.52810 Transcript_37440/m.52810 type:complete len:103 (+) Transcript_37440:236-544(+)
MKKGTQTMRPIKKKDIPHRRTSTYTKFVAAYRPEKDNPFRLRITAGGNLIFYPGPTSTKAADLTTVKLLVNSTLSDRRAKFATFDIKDFYMNTPLMALCTLR